MIVGCWTPHTNQSRKNQNDAVTHDVNVLKVFKLSLGFMDRFMQIFHFANKEISTIQVVS